MRSAHPTTYYYERTVIILILTMKKTFSILRQIAIVSAIAFVLTEITFRIYHRINPSFMFYDTSYNRWRGKPFAEDYDFRLNSRGFKDVEFSQQKEKRTYRIIGLGDSFAYGVVPYQHNYLTLLEEELNNNNKSKIEVLNMGLIGTGPKDYLSILVNEGLALNPDMVLLSFYVGNDFIDNRITAKERKILSDRDSYVISFVRGLIKIYSQYQGHVYFTKDDKYEDEGATFTDEVYLQQTQERSLIFNRNPVEPEFFQNAFNDALGDLLKIKEICDYKNITLVVVLIPDEVQVSPILQQKVIEAFRVSPDAFDFQLPNKLLRAEFEKHNINYLDLFDNFMVVNPQVSLYKPNDTHWNIAGNELAAEVIDNYLSEKFLE